eukprot:CAMPEP_0119117108 /NCGR_PEP_ID=MMETSP1180-20130426/52656_1 /TAXON_ID=3052 ORGANISM="Chlamydomonas cf sp, Strain CCMP681" /NCGR_SAMPLE_ID=MMETSP1180 /ASSEMBLY_ACC=CAM_ASM_000741 /LENGTH=280 /DNA_ID=CAMNT_0007106329 /DNA_START=151 /DNA_END=996 /DNA_ORIENTATION=+
MAAMLYGQGSRRRPSKVDRNQACHNLLALSVDGLLFKLSTAHEALAKQISVRNTYFTPANTSNPSAPSTRLHANAVGTAQEQAPQLTPCAAHCKTLSAPLSTAVQHLCKATLALGPAPVALPCVHWVCHPASPVLPLLSAAPGLHAWFAWQVCLVQYWAHVMDLGTDIRLVNLATEVDQHGVPSLHAILQLHATIYMLSKAMSGLIPVQPDVGVAALWSPDSIDDYLLQHLAQTCVGPQGVCNLLAVNGKPVDVPIGLSICRPQYGGQLCTVHIHVNPSE